MQTFAAVIEAFGGAGVFGPAIGITEGHARVMKSRDSIPSPYWPQVVSAARKLGLRKVTYRLLAAIAARRRKMRLARAA